MFSQTMYHMRERIRTRLCRFRGLLDPVSGATLIQEKPKIFCSAQLLGHCIVIFFIFDRIGKTVYFRKLVAAK